MQNRTVMGIFDRPDDAEKLKDELLEAGVARHRIVISRLATHDRQAGDDAFVGEVPDPEQLAQAVRSVACVVSVVARSPLDKEEIARLMRRHGARETIETRSR